MINSLIIFSYQPSKADVSVFETLDQAPTPSFINVLRWYNNIASYTNAERNKFAGKPWPVKAEPKKAAQKAPADDDDDLDLFGSDDEVHI